MLFVKLARVYAGGEVRELTCVSKTRQFWGGIFHVG